MMHEIFLNIKIFYIRIIDLMVSILLANTVVVNFYSFLSLKRNTRGSNHVHTRKTER